MSKIQEAIQQMSIDEMQQRLAEYMAADKKWAVHDGLKVILDSDLRCCI